MFFYFENVIYFENVLLLCRTSSDLFRELDRLSVGDEAQLKVMRQDSIEDISILLEERRDSKA